MGEGLWRRSPVSSLHRWGRGWDSLFLQCLLPASALHESPCRVSRRPCVRQCGQTVPPRSTGAQCRSPHIARETPVVRLGIGGDASPVQRRHFGTATALTALARRPPISSALVKRRQNVRALQAQKNPSPISLHRSMQRIAGTQITLSAQPTAPRPNAGVCRLLPGSGGWARRDGSSIETAGHPRA
jgi:hypothetical protein